MSTAVSCEGCTVSTAAGVAGTSAGSGFFWADRLDFLGKPNTASLKASSRLALRVFPAICFLKVMGGVWFFTGEGLRDLAGLGLTGEGVGTTATGAGCFTGVAGSGAAAGATGAGAAGSGSIYGSNTSPNLFS